MNLLRRLRGTDWILAALFAAAGCAEVVAAPDPPTAGLQFMYVVVTAAAVLVRRVAPVWSATGFLAATVVVCVATQPLQMLTIGVAFTVLPFFYAMELSGCRLVLALGMLVLAVALRSAADPGEDWGAALVDQGFLALAAGAGSAVLHYRRRVEHVAKSASVQVDDAIAMERAWIARELHDIVGHGIGVMIIQADSARHCLGPDQNEVRAALVSIEQTGRDSLREMRRLLGLLRDDDGAGAGAGAGEASLEPTPSMADLSDLVDSVRRAGLAVDLRVEGQPSGLSHGVALTAFRVVQEALTNVLRHAGPARAHVHVSYGEHDLAVEIVDDGRLRPPETARGRGLVGLRERVRLYGGTFAAGPEGQHWVVRATLPLDGSALS